MLNNPGGQHFACMKCGYSANSHERMRNHMETFHRTDAGQWSLDKAMSKDAEPREMEHLEREMEKLFQPQQTNAEAQHDVKSATSTLQDEQMEVDESPNPAK